MLKQLSLLQNIAFKLSYLQACVSTLNSIQFFSLNVVAEDFFAKLLNEVYGYDLQNLNHSDLNSVAIDLGDTEQRIGVQVTSQRRKDKVQKTIDKFASHGLETDYVILKIFIIGKRTGKYKNLRVPDAVAFSGETDVIDIDDLMRDIARLDVAKQEKIWSIIAGRTSEYPGTKDSNAPLSELLKHSVNDKAQQRKSIGFDFEITRTEVWKSITANVNEKPLSHLIVVGDSGCGKSAVAAYMSQHLIDEWEVVFLRFDSLMRLWDVERDSGSSFSISQGLAQIQPNRAIVAIDGIDRAQTSEQIRELAKFINAVQQSDRLKLVLTCQQEHLSRIQTKLVQTNCNITEFDQIQVGGFNAEELKQVCQKFPKLKLLLTRPNLHSLYRRPFVIDALLQAARQATIENELAGESHLIDWFWENHVSDIAGTSVSKALIQLAQSQADNSETLTHDVNVADGDSVDVAIQLSLLTRSGGAVRFSHDMYADWARSRFLLAQGEQLANAMSERSTNPMWHRAIRLVSIHLLERGHGSKWRELVAKDSPARGLLLDGLLFCSDTLGILMNSMELLLENGSELLNQLVKRAQIVITQPSYLVEQREQAGEKASPHLRVLQRDPKPYVHQFGSLLLILLVCLKKSEESRSQVGHDAALAAKLWLEMTHPSWPYRQQAAEIAILLADEIDEDAYYDDKEEVDVCKSLLHAFRQKPDAVKPKLLAFAGLDSDSPKARQEQEKNLKSEVQLDSNDVEAWKHGPLYRPNEAFRKACLDWDSMWPVVVSDAPFAREVVLALILEKSRHAFRRSYLDIPYSSSDCGLVRGHVVFGQTHYMHGPWLQFLNYDPMEGARLVVDVANAASWNYVRGLKARRGTEQPDSIFSPMKPGEHWYGNEISFSWNRGYMGGCEQIVPALSALEKYLGDLIEAGESMGAVIEDILFRNSSVAIAGMLFDVGRRHPNLFESILRPLLNSPKLIVWAETLSRHNNQPRFGGPATDYGDWFFEEHKAWLSAKYRNLRILKVASEVIDDSDSFWNEVASEIRDQVGGPLEPTIESLANAFNQRSPHDNFNYPFRNEELSQEPEEREHDNPIQETARIGWAIYDFLANRRMATKESLESHEILCIEDIEDDDPNLLALKRNNFLGERIFLLRQHADWLHKQGLHDRFLEEVITFEQVQPPIISEEILSVDNVPLFDVFAARLAVDTFAANTDDPVVRRWLARMVLDGDARVHHAVVATAWKHRKALDDWLARIIWLVLNAACGNWESNRNYFNSGPTTHVFERDTWLAKMFDSFLEETCPARVPNPEDVYLSSPPIRYDNDGHYYVNGEETDVYFFLQPINIYSVNAVLNAIPLSEDLDDRQELVDLRMSVAAFNLDVQTRMLESCDKEGKVLPIANDRHPSMTGQRTIIERVASEMLALPFESTRILWEKIFALGVTAPNWIDTLVMKWLWPSVTQPNLPEHFEETWDAAIEYVSGHPNWQSDLEGRSWESPLHEMYARVLGVDKSFYSLWESSHSQLATRRTKSFVTLLKRVVCCRSTAAPAIRWISNYQGKIWQLEALAWIAQANFDFVDNSNDDQVVNAIAELLGVIYRDRKKSLTGNTQDQFNQILASLVRTGNAVAIDVNQQVAGLQ